jgi:hypothetical protein
MSSQAYAERLSRSLESTGLAEVVKTSFGENNISVLCRVKQGSDGEWVKIVERLLLAENAAARSHSPVAWASHICRRYFLKDFPEGQKMVFGWNVAIQSGDLHNSLDAISRVIRGESYQRSKSGELEEVPLVGVGPSRQAPKKDGPGKGKGAYTIGGSNDFNPSK